MLPVRAAGAFACNGCGHCCRNLSDGAPVTWPDGFDALAPFGLYMLPAKGGLSVWSGERRAMLKEAKRRGLDLAFRPALAAVDDERGLVVFAWEAEAESCPFVDDANRCTIYDLRPTACRAFPLRFRANGWTAAESCDAAFAPASGDWTRAYDGCLSAALAARRAPAEAVARLQALEAAGRLAPQTRLAKDEVARALARRRLVDADDLEAAP